MVRRSKLKMQNSKLKCKIQKLTKVGVLIGIREGYLFVRNLLGLYEHPFLTTKRIVQDKDLSQGILIFGLPIGLWLGWVFVLLVSRFFIFGRLQFGFLAKASFLVSSLFTSFCLLLIAYCFYMVWKKGRMGN